MCLLVELFFPAANSVVNTRPIFPQWDFWSGWMSRSGGPVGRF